MYDGKTFLGIIPARGGSKGIPQKNITPVNSKPLIDYSIKAALNSTYLDEVIVSTDCEKIVKLSQECGAKVPFMRPPELSGDNSKTIDAIVFTVDKLAEQDFTYDYVVLLQPTQPLRKSFHIDEAIKLITDEKSDSLVSISTVKEHPILMRTIDENGELKNLLDMNSTVRRQDFPDYYKVNGSIYINKIKHSDYKSISFNDNRLPYVMNSEYDLDVDDPIDLELLKLKLKEE